MTSHFLSTIHNIVSCVHLQNALCSDAAITVQVSMTPETSPTLDKSQFIPEQQGIQEANPGIMMMGSFPLSDISDSGLTDLPDQLVWPVRRESTGSSSWSDSIYQLFFDHSCSFAGTPREELCQRDCLFKECYKEGKDRVFMSRCNQPIRLLCRKGMESPPFELNEVSVEILHEDTAAAKGPASPAISSQTGRVNQTGNCKLRAQPRLVGGDDATVDGLDGAKSKISSSVLRGLKFRGHSSKSGNVAMQPLLRLRCSAQVEGSHVGPILSNRFMVSSNQSDNPKVGTAGVEG